MKTKAIFYKVSKLIMVDHLRTTILWVVLLSGLYEFQAAYSWWNSPEENWHATNGMLPKEVTNETFLTILIPYLLTLGFIRIGIFCLPNSRITIILSTLVHVPEAGFWWYWALKPKYMNAGPMIDVMSTFNEIILLAVDVALLGRGTHAALVLLGPSILILLQLYLLATTTPWKPPPPPTPPPPTATTKKNQ